MMGTEDYDIEVERTVTVRFTGLDPMTCRDRQDRRQVGVREVWITLTDDGKPVRTWIRGRKFPILADGRLGRTEGPYSHYGANPAWLTSLLQQARAIAHAAWTRDFDPFTITRAEDVPPHADDAPWDRR